MSKVYLALVIFQGIVPSDKLKKGEWLREGSFQKPQSHPPSVRRDLICLDIEDI